MCAGKKLVPHTEDVSNGTLGTSFGLKGEEATGGRRELHEKERRNLYSSSNAIRRMRLVGHAANGRDQKYAQKFCKGREDLGIDGRKILETILKK